MRYLFLLLLILPLSLMGQNQPRESPPCRFLFPNSVNRSSPSNIEIRLESDADSFNLKIYNRWGQLQWEATSPDELLKFEKILLGEKKALTKKKMEAGVYFFIISGFFRKELFCENKGSITIVD